MRSRMYLFTYLFFYIFNISEFGTSLKIDGVIKHCALH